MNSNAAVIVEVKRRLVLLPKRIDTW
jgi:hypothetical protein